MRTSIKAALLTHPTSVYLALGLICSVACIISACTPIQTPLPPEPTGTAQPATATPTPTIVWFPPTSTPTFLPTPVVTPTQELSLPFGDILLSDNFSESGMWTLGQTVQASAALGVNELTLALHQPDGYLYSLRQEPLLDDFYLEITASPNLCRDADEYGLLLRVSPSLDFYRFSLSCNGQARLDKYFQGVASFPSTMDNKWVNPSWCPKHFSPGRVGKG